MKAQVGVEIMGIVGFAFLVLIPMFIMFYSYSNSLWDRLSIEKADAAARSLSNLVEIAGSQGDGFFSQEIVIPENVKGIEVRGNEIILSISTNSGTTEIVKLTTHPVSSSFSNLGPGSYLVKAEARKGEVTLGLGK